MINNIINRLSSLKNREKIIKSTKYKKDYSSGVTRSKLSRIKEYDYYICDYCQNKLVIKEEMNGGIVEIPKSISAKPFKLVLHNCCLKLTLKELEGLRNVI